MSLCYMNSIVLITVDCLRADHVSAYGYERETTPNIDRVASDGTVYKYAYSNGPGTRFAFKTLCSGVHPLRIEGAGLPSVDNATVSEVCRQNGLSTAAFSYNGFLSSYFNYDRGFDEFIDIVNWGEDRDVKNTPSFKLRKIKQKIGDVLPDNRIYSFADSMYERLLTTAQSNNIIFSVTDEDVIDRALLWLDRTRHSSEPYFLWVHLMDAHAPYRYSPDIGDDLDVSIPSSDHVRSPWDEFEDGSKLPQRVLDNYDTNIRTADRQVGRLVDAIDQQTTVIITADHGEEFGEHNSFHSPSPYETMSRIPLIISGPAFEARECATPVSHLDIPPTIVDVIGSSIPESWSGSSLKGIDRDDQTPLYIAYQGDIEADRPNTQVHGGVVKPPWKLVIKQNDIADTSYEKRLLNFETNPTEDRDVSEDRQTVLEDLDSHWRMFVDSISTDRMKAERPIWDCNQHLDSTIRSDETRQTPTDSDDVAEKVEMNLDYLGYK